MNHAQLTGALDSDEDKVRAVAPRLSNVIPLSRRRSMPEPTMVDIESSHLRAVGYDPATKTLHVEFKPKPGEEVRPHYTHQDVSPELHEGLMKAESKGKFYNEHLRGRFSPERSPGT